MKVALVYDRVNKFGGAERVLLALHEIYPKAPLYTSVYDEVAAPWAEVFDMRTSFLQKLPLPKNAHESYPFLMGLAFESFDFDEYDVVISVTAEFAKAIITKPKTFHLCYCLTPVGYLWDSYLDYHSAKPPFFRAITLPIIKYLRWYDKIIANRPDAYISISKTVQQRIKKIYSRESDIIYPPVNLGKPNSSSGDYFLVVSRLVAHKRIDLAVKAFNKLGLPLKIIGAGSEEKRLRATANQNIEFLGYLTDEEVTGYYKSCRAVIIPGIEDFNLVAVEAQSFGKPVIALGRGGVTETVVDGKTGWFFKDPKPGSLVDLVNKLGNFQVDPKECWSNAKEFSEEKFLKKFKEVAERKYQEYVRHS